MELNLLARPSPSPNTDMMDREVVTTYREACEAAGVVNPEIVMEDFKYFLNAADLPVFSLAAVVSFMDDLTAKDNPSKLGWEWLPVRESDRIGHSFGRPATEDRSAARREALAAWAEASETRRSSGFFAGKAKAAVPRIGVRQAPTIIPASDYYAGTGAMLYARAIPLHALAKIARVEKEFGVGKVVFMITDYVLEPHVVIEPDPFLMAVVPNKDLAKGVGRFVIDVWDEPGFGIAQMLK